VVAAAVFEFYLIVDNCSNDNLPDRSYTYVRADNISQAFDCALTRTNARNPQSYVEVIAAQELREPVDVYIRSIEVSLTPIDDLHGVS